MIPPSSLIPITPFLVSLAKKQKKKLYNFGGHALFFPISILIFMLCLHFKYSSFFLQSSAQIQFLTHAHISLAFGMCGD